MDKNRVNKLSEVTTVKDYLNYLLENYDTDNCRPGKFAKNILINALSSMATSQSPRAIQLASAEAVNANNITEFIVIIKRSFDTNTAITATEEKLQDNTKKLCTMVSLKPKRK